MTYPLYRVMVLDMLTIQAGKETRMRFMDHIRWPMLAS